MALKNFTGTGVAMITPFRKDGSVDFKSLEKLTNHIIEGGVDFLVMVGTTSESPVLTKEEKSAIISHVTEITNNRVPIVVGFGGNNTQAVVDSIKEADFSKIDGILSVTPAYNKPGQKGIYQHYKAIASACPAPVILYNVPSRTGISMNADTTLKLANEFENIVAVKEASGNFDEIMKIIQHKPDNFNVLSGDDAINLPLISVGMSGVISVVGNVCPQETSQLINLALKGKMKQAQEIHYRILDIITLLFKEGNPSGVKAFLNILGIVENNLRLPLTPVSRTTYNQMVKAIEELRKY